MAMIHISDEAYQQLVRQAAEQHTTVEKLVEPAIRKIASSQKLSELATTELRSHAFNDWMQLVQKRSERYPSGFAADDSRESIYAGRGE